MRWKCKCCYHFYTLVSELGFKYSVKSTSCKVNEDDHIGQVNQRIAFSHSNHLQYFYTPTWVGCNNHVGFFSPAYTRNKLSIVILGLFSRNRVDRTKLIGSHWHGQRSMVSIYLKRSSNMQSINEMSSRGVFP